MKILIILSLAAICLADRPKIGRKGFQFPGRVKSSNNSHTFIWTEFGNIPSLHPERSGNDEKSSEESGMLLSNPNRRDVKLGFQGASLIKQGKSSSSEESQANDNKQEKSSSEEPSAQVANPEVSSSEENNAPALNQQDSSSEENNAPVVEGQESSSEEASVAAVNQEVPSSEENNAPAANQQVSASEENNTPVAEGQASPSEETNAAVAIPKVPSSEENNVIAVNQVDSSSRENNVPATEVKQSEPAKKKRREVNSQRPKSAKHVRVSGSRLQRSAESNIPDLGFKLHNAGNTKALEPQGGIKAQKQNRFRRPSKQ